MYSYSCELNIMHSLHVSQRLIIFVSICKKAVQNQHFLIVIYRDRLICFSECVCINYSLTMCVFSAVDLMFCCSFFVDSSLLLDCR